MKASTLSVPGGIVAASLLAATLGLTGCTSSSSSPTASPAAKSTTTPSATSSPTAPAVQPPPATTAPATVPTTAPVVAPAMNIAQIAQGNYSSIAGNWKDANGLILTITGDTLSRTAISDNPGFLDSAIINFGGDTLTLDKYYPNGNIGIVYSTIPASAGADYGGGVSGIEVAPAHTAVQIDGADNVGPDASDTSQDRIFITSPAAGLNPFLASSGLLNYIYYRAS